MPHAVAVILARAGSKGLPGKNARRIAGRPMISHSIDHARSASTVQRLLVSTDCPQVAAAARAAEVEVIERPPHLADDHAPVDAAVRHAVEDDDSPIVVILYGNVPVRPPGLIDRAVHRLVESGADSVQSYASVGKHHPFWEVRLDANGRVEPYVENTIHRRQDLPPLYVPDGGVIAVTRGSLFNIVEGRPHAFLGRDRRGIVNEPGAVIDIDTEIDLIVAETILKKGTTDARG